MGTVSIPMLVGTVVAAVTELPTRTPSPRSTLSLVSGRLPGALRAVASSALHVPGCALRAQNPGEEWSQRHPPLLEEQSARREPRGEDAEGRKSWWRLGVKSSGMEAAFSLHSCALERKIL